MIWFALVFLALLIIVAALVGVVWTVWEYSAPAFRARRELEDTYDAVDAVLEGARSEMEHVAYRSARTRQLTSGNLGNWEEWWS